MEITGCELLVSLSIMLLFGLTFALAVKFWKKRSVLASIGVGIIGLAVSLVIGHLFDGAEVIVIKSDGEVRRSSWIGRFKDSNGTSYPLDSRRAYLFLDSSSDSPQGISISFFSVVFTTELEKVGKPVDVPITTFTLAARQMTPIPHVSWAFKTGPAYLKTADCSREVSVSCVNFTSHVDTPLRYRELVYDPPVYY